MGGILSFLKPTLREVGILFLYTLCSSATRFGQFCHSTCFEYRFFSLTLSLFMVK